MEVIKSRSEVGTCDISIKESETKSLALVWGGNGDLYWILDDLEDIDVKDDPMYDSFCITKVIKVK
jgi:endo-1,4-beta-mannosidase